MLRDGLVRVESEAAWLFQPRSLHRRASSRTRDQADAICIASTERPVISLRALLYQRTDSTRFPPATLARPHRRHGVWRTASARLTATLSAPIQDGRQNKGGLDDQPRGGDVVPPRRDRKVPLRRHGEPAVSLLARERGATSAEVADSGPEYADDNAPRRTPSSRESSHDQSGLFAGRATTTTRLCGVTSTCSGSSNSA